MRMLYCMSIMTVVVVLLLLLLVVYIYMCRVEKMREILFGKRPEHGEKRGRKGADYEHKAKQRVLYKVCFWGCLFVCLFVFVCLPD